jgi:hypothetical protein
MPGYRCVGPLQYQHLSGRRHRLQLGTEQFKKLLETAEEEVPELVPFLAMAGFAGARRSELVREYAEDQVLEWEDVDWQKQLITARLLLPSPADISLGACWQSSLVSFSEYCLPASLNPTRAKFVQSESGSLILQPRRKRSIVVIDPPICIPSTPPFVDSEAVRQGIRTRGGWVSPESLVFLEPRRAQIES